MKQRTGSKLETGHETKDWFKIGKGLLQGYILLPCLFNFYVEYIMRNARLEESQWNWNKDCQDKYQQPQINRCYHSNGRKKRGTKKPLDEAERRK